MISARRLLLNNARIASRSRKQQLTNSLSRRCFVSFTQQSHLSVVSPQQQPKQSSCVLLTNNNNTNNNQRWLSSSSDDLPYHIVVGMPALSPTMTSGTISKWNVGEGESFSAGDSLAVIETDKATIDFEAQDDGVVAKLLVPEGGGELDVGLPIMVTVEETDDVGAFANFVPDASGGGGGSGDDDAAAPADTPPPAAAAAAAPATPAEDLPYHIVVGMPALSPTMEAGTISKWNVAEGESFAAGDSLAVIETDKATIDFEAQDDGVVGKLLKEAGSGEVAVGVPIMVTVEEESDVAAFKNFVAGSAPDSSATEASVPPPVEEVKAPEPVAAAAPTPAAASTAPTPVAAVAPAVETAPSPVAGAVSVGGFSWGQLAAESSPLARTLASKQKEYIEKYGSTGHVPLV